MSTIEITSKIESLRELEELIEEAKTEAETLRDEIKAEMLKYIIRWTSVLSNRFDTTGFKKAYGELYKQYTKQTASRRFTISA